MIPKYYTFFLTTLCGMICSNFLCAQEKFQLKTFSTDNGLSNNLVQNIACDQTGFLWIATWDGLSRFDGNEFKNYFHKPEDPNSIPFFSTDKVVVDRMNNVWLFCSGRKAVVLNRSTDRFEPFNINGENDSRLGNLTLGPDKNIWLSLGLKSFYYNPQSKEIKSFRIEGNQPDIVNWEQYPPQLIFDNKEGLWLYNWEKNSYIIFRATFGKDSIINTQYFATIPLEGYKSSGIHDEVVAPMEFYISESGKIWLFTIYDLFVFDPVKNQFISNNSPDIAEFQGKPFFTWASNNLSINIIDTKNKTLTNICEKSGNFIETLFCDSSGIIWSGEVNLSRENIGLNKYVQTSKFFKHYLTGNNEHGNQNLIFPIVKDRQKKLWVGTRYLDYLFRIGPDGKEEKVFYSKTPNHPVARSLAETQDGLWIGTTGSELIFYDFATHKTSIKYPFKNFKSPQPTGFHNILLENNEVIINNATGIFRYNPETESCNLLCKHVPGGNGFCLVSDSKGGFWIGTDSNTVIHIIPGSNQIKRYQIGNEGNIAEHICLGDDNDIWVAFMGGGLGHLHPDTGATEIITTADGLPSNVLSAILKDKKGNLWISTNQGISMYSPATKHFRNFSSKDGLIITDFNTDSFFQSDDGEMFFGGIGGMVSFYPDNIENSDNSEKKAPLIVTDVSVSGVPRFFEKPVYETKSISLSKGDNNIKLKFACLDFKNSEKIRYRYRFSGINDRWSETDYRNRVANYSGLNPGHYRFDLEATDSNGQWVSNVSLNVEIPYYYYQTRWFKLLILILASATASFVVWLYVRQIRLKWQKREGELRLESLRGQMNPHFIFNSLNSINYFISRNDKLMANLYIADFSRLIRSILTDLSVDYITFEKEIESISDYLKLEHLRFSDKFNYTVDTSAIKKSSQLQIFPGMVQPFIENAIWHGVRGLEDRQGILKVIFIPGKDDSVRCLVEDDGVGRKLSELFKTELPGKKSRGIGIVQERLKVVNNMKKTSYQVVIEDCFPEEKETGTRVIIDIPAKYRIS